MCWSGDESLDPPPKVNASFSISPITRNGSSKTSSAISCCTASHASPQVSFAIVFSFVVLTVCIDETSPDRLVFLFDLLARRLCAVGGDDYAAHRGHLRVQ